MARQRFPQSHPQTEHGGSAETVNATVAPEDAPSPGDSAADSRDPRDDDGSRDRAAGCPDGAIPAHLLADGNGNARGPIVGFTCGSDGTAYFLRQPSVDGTALGDGDQRSADAIAGDANAGGDYEHPTADDLPATGGS